jgi:hypothetical protein
MVADHHCHSRLSNNLVGLGTALPVMFIPSQVNKEAMIITSKVLTLYIVIAVPIRVEIKANNITLIFPIRMKVVCLLC